MAVTICVNFESEKVTIDGVLVNREINLIKEDEYYYEYN